METQTLVKTETDPWKDLNIAKLSKKSILLNFKVVVKILNLRRKKNTLTIVWSADMLRYLNVIFSKVTEMRQLIKPVAKIRLLENYPLDDYIISCLTLKKTPLGYCPVWLLEFPKELVP